MPSRLLLSAALIAVAVSSAAAQTTRFHGSVVATADIYGIEGKLPVGATRPKSFSLPADAACVSFTKVRGSFVAPQCNSIEGCITVNASQNHKDYNDPDGNMAQVSESSSTGRASISGIIAPGAGYLVGLFTQGKPSGMHPPRLNFTRSPKTSFRSLAPLLDQTFFVGDGRRKDDRSVHQRFSVPVGSTDLYLGISDGCNYTGLPNCYFDNEGFYNVVLEVSTTACPTP